MTIQIPKEMQPLRVVTVPAWQPKSSNFVEQFFFPPTVCPQKSGQGLQKGRVTLLFQTHFNPQEADRPSLYVTDGQGKFAYMGQEVPADSATVEDASGVWTTTFSINGRPFLSKTAVEAMKVLTVFWKVH